MLDERFSSLQKLRQHIGEFRDPIEREMAEALLFQGARSAAAETKKHILVLLHGMNTYAEWQEVLAEPIRNETNIEPAVVGYGNFHPVKFFMPGRYRQKRIDVVLRDLTGLRASNPNADISIVAHSFGSYIFSKIIEKSAEIKFHRVILCGSVVETDYNWAAVSRRMTAPVVNDIGRWDYWPSLAKSWSWGYGDSGSLGFKNSFVRDRYYDFGHSDFLNVEHMKNYWLPYLIDGRVVSSPYTNERPKIQGIERVVRDFSWFYLLLIAFFVYVGFLIF